MVAKSRLRLALAAHKGVDFHALKQKKQRKQALKAKQRRQQTDDVAPDQKGAILADDQQAVPDQDQDWVDNDDDDDGSGDGDHEDDEDDEGPQPLDLEAIDDSESDSDMEMEEALLRVPRPSRPSQPSLAVSERQPAVARGNGSAIKHGQANSAETKPKDGAKDGAEDEAEDEDDEEDDEEDDGIPMSDLDDLDEDEREDLIPHAKLTINNTAAILGSLARIALPTDSSVPFQTHQSITSAGPPTGDAVPDVSDDLERELAFFAQGLEAATTARTRLRAEQVLFSRPPDYYAEMVKEDAHMEKVRAKLVEEASAKKAAAEARNLRDRKKFAKQVQVAKLQERHKAKRDALDKIKQLKRKRQDNTDDLGTREADLFDVAVDEEIDRHKKRKLMSGDARGSGRGAGGAGGAGPGTARAANPKRQNKNEKYGFGGKKRHAKSGDAVSSGDLTGFSTRKMKGGVVNKGAGGRGRAPSKPQRLGKSRRKGTSRG